jgi:hypothetical protein
VGGNPGKKVEKCCCQLGKTMGGLKWGSSDTIGPLEESPGKKVETYPQSHGVNDNT